MTVKDLMSTFWSFASFKRCKEWRGEIFVRGGQRLTGFDETYENWKLYQNRIVSKWSVDRGAIHIVVEPIDTTEALNEKEQIAKGALSYYERRWTQLPASSQKDDAYRATRDIKDYLKAIDTIRDIEAKKLF